MNKSLVQKLIKLNLAFYQKIATDFDQSRQYPWPGWQQLLPLLKKMFNQSPPAFIDLGCGNGRFGLFLDKNFPKKKFYYLGVDSDKVLLKKAQEQLKFNLFKSSFIKKDIFKLVLENKLSDFLKSELKIIKDYFPIQVVTILGVMHHLPSKKLREEFLKEIAKVISPGSIVIISLWDFYDFSRFRKKLITPEKAGLDAKTLEDGDYIMDWQRGQEAYRYCHHFSELEKKELVKASSLKLVKSFHEDGRENTGNHYLVLKKE